MVDQFHEFNVPKGCIITKRDRLAIKNKTKYKNICVRPIMNKQCNIIELEEQVIIPERLADWSHIKASKIKVRNNLNELIKLNRDHCIFTDHINEGMIWTNQFGPVVNKMEWDIPDLEISSGYLTVNLNSMTPMNCMWVIDNYLQGQLKVGMHDGQKVKLAVANELIPNSNICPALIGQVNSPELLFKNCVKLIKKIGLGHGIDRWLRKYNKIWFETYNASDHKYVHCNHCNHPNVFNMEAARIENHDEYDVNMTIRCGFCMLPLNYDVKVINDIWYEPTHIINVVPSFYGKLDELKTIKVSDWYESLDMAQRQNLMARDMKIMRRDFYNNYGKIVIVPQNLGEGEFDMISSTYNNCIIERSLTAVCLSPMLVANESGMLGYITHGLKNCNVVGSMINYMNINKIFKVKQVVNESINILSVKSKVIDLMDAINNISYQSVIFVILINHENDKYTLDEINGCILDLENHNYVKVDTQLYKLVENDLLVYKDTALICELISCNDHIKLYSIRLRSNKSAQIINDNKMLTETIELPLPDDSLGLGDLQVTGWRTKTFKLNRELLRALCLRNINGKLGYEALMEYATGYSLRRYVIKRTFTYMPDMDYEEINAHVLLSRLIMIKENHNRKYGMQIKTLGLMFNTIMQLGVTIYNKYVSNIINLFKEFIGKDSLDLLTIENWVKNLSETSNIDTICEYTIKHLLRSRVAINISPITRPTHVCNHHSEDCMHDIDDCICCNPGEQTNSYCACCAINLPEHRKYNTVELKQNNTSKQVSTVRKRGTTYRKLEGDKDKTMFKQTEKAKRKIDLWLPSEPEAYKVVKKYVNIVPTGLMDYNLNAEYINNNLEMYNYASEPKNWYKNCINNGFCKIVIPYMNMGLNTLWVKPFKLIQSHDTVNSSYNSCGYEAFKVCTGLNIDIQVFKEISNIEHTWSVDEILRVAEVLSENLIIIEANAVTAIKTNNSDIFSTMAHGSFTGHGFHYVGVEVELIDHPRHILCLNYDDESDNLRRTLYASYGYDYYKGSMDLAIPLMVQFTVESYIDMSRSQKIKDLMAMQQMLISSNKHNVILTNNEQNINDWVTGKYSITLSSSVNDEIMMLSDDTGTNIRSEKYEERYDIPKEIPDNLEELYTSLVKSLVYTMQLIRYNRYIGNYSDIIKHWQDYEIINYGGYVSMETNENKLKTFDMILIKIGKEMLLRSVLVQDNKVYFYCDTNKTHKLHIGVLKMSIGSIIRKLNSLGDTIADGLRLQEIISNSEIFDGVPGCGKTTSLIENYKEGDIIICLTSGAIKNIRKRNSECNVISLERAAQISTANFNNVLIDEAGSLNYMDVMFLCKWQFNKLYLYGDSLQVGVVDFSKLSGFRSNVNLLNMKSHEYKTVSLRVGYPLANEIAKLIPDFVGNKEVVTDFDLIQIRSEQYIRDLVDICKDFKPDIILTPYNNNREQIKFITGNEWESDKTHSYQGNEVNNVIVVLKMNKLVWGLNGNLNYLISAMTRAKSKLLLIIVDYYKEISDITELI